MAQERIKMRLEAAKDFLKAGYTDDVAKLLDEVLLYDLKEPCSQCKIYAAGINEIARMAADEKKEWKADYTVNRNVNTDTIAALVAAAFSAYHENDMDMLHDLLCSLHSQFYPGASRVLSPEECKLRSS